MQIIVVVVGVSGKDNAKCWKIDGTHAPGRGAVVDRSLARNFSIIDDVNVHAAIA